ncbi:hypothetical protein HK100_009550, partial [Physocladia obscura]
TYTANAETILIDNVLPLSSATMPLERKDILVSVKIFLSHLSSWPSTAVAETIHDALKSTSSFLTTKINILTIELPSTIQEQNTHNELPSLLFEPARKSRRLSSSSFSFQGKHPDIAGDELLWQTVVSLAQKKFGVNSIAVSSAFPTRLAAFLAAVPLENQELFGGIVLDLPRKRHTGDDKTGNRIERENKMLVQEVEAVGNKYSVRVMVSNDGQEDMLAYTFKKVIERVNAAEKPHSKFGSERDSNEYPSQDWVTKYTCFDVERSVLLQHGYLAMGSSTLH